MTDEEYKKAQDDLLRRDALPGRDSRESNGKDIRGTEKDVARAYNEHWFGDKPTEMGRRTSMIDDPPDGRMPALTPEAQKRIGEKREYLILKMRHYYHFESNPLVPEKAHIALPTGPGFNVQLDPAKIESQTILKPN